MEDAHFTENEKSKTREVKCEKDAHCSFPCSRNRPPGIRSSWTNCQPGILLGGFEAIERECTKKSPELWRSGDWFLLDDNAPVPTALTVTRYLAPLGWTVVPHSHYSPDRRFPLTLFTGPSPL
jgi:hypothetical protein